MKLLHYLCSSFYSLHSLANFARPRCTLFAITKKPAPLAGFSYLRLYLTRLTTFILLPTLTFRYPRSSQLSFQTPNYPNPA
jgi:hypothetical protein